MPQARHEPCRHESCGHAFASTEAWRERRSRVEKTLLTTEFRVGKKLELVAKDIWVQRGRGQAEKAVPASRRL
eukprot:6195391-Pleurochrysis_carterae.AAC.3